MPDCAEIRFMAALSWLSPALMMPMAKDACAPWISATIWAAMPALVSNWFTRPISPVKFRTTVKLVLPVPVLLA